jgi:hypothetical protein
LFHPGKVFFYPHVKKRITEYSYKCKKKILADTENLVRDGEDENKRMRLFLKCSSLNLLATHKIPSLTEGGG